MVALQQDELWFLCCIIDFSLAVVASCCFSPIPSSSNLASEKHFLDSLRCL
jgi:hypothetical protein